MGLRYPARIYCCFYIGAAQGESRTTVYVPDEDLRGRNIVPRQLLLPLLAIYYILLSVTAE